MDPTTLVPSENLFSQALSHKAKLLCSFGGKILSRPGDSILRYIGGHTRLISVPMQISFPDFISKLSTIIPTSSSDQDPNPTSPRIKSVKYQLPGEDLDSLVSVSNQEDLENMMEEYAKLADSFTNGSAKLRVFLFPPSETDLATDISIDPGQYVEALNSALPIIKGDNSTQIKENSATCVGPSTQNSDSSFNQEGLDSVNEGAVSYTGNQANQPRVVMPEHTANQLPPPVTVYVPTQSDYIERQPVQYINPQQIGAAPPVNAIPLLVNSTLIQPVPVTTAALSVPPVTPLDNQYVRATTDQSNYKVLQPLSQLPPLPPMYLQPRSSDKFSLSYVGPTSQRYDDCAMCQKSLPHAHSDNMIPQSGNNASSPVGGSETGPVFYSLHSNITANQNSPTVGGNTVYYRTNPEQHHQEPDLTHKVPVESNFHGKNLFEVKPNNPPMMNPYTESQVRLQTGGPVLVANNLLNPGFVNEQSFVQTVPVHPVANMSQVPGMISNNNVLLSHNLGTPEYPHDDHNKNEIRVNQFFGPTDANNAPCPPNNTINVPGPAELFNEPNSVFSNTSQVPSIIANNNIPFSHNPGIPVHPQVDNKDEILINQIPAPPAFNNDPCPPISTVNVPRPAELISEPNSLYSNMGIVPSIIGDNNISLSHKIGTPVYPQMDNKDEVLVNQLSAPPTVNNAPCPPNGTTNVPQPTELINEPNSLFSNHDPWKAIGNNASLMPPQPSKLVINEDPGITKNNNLIMSNGSDIILLDEDKLPVSLEWLKKEDSPPVNKASGEESVKRQLQEVAEGVAASVLENNIELERVIDAKVEDLKNKGLDKVNPGVPLIDEIGHLQVIKNSDLEELRELGSGTFGTVYHGNWRGSDVAIKRINDRCFSGKPSEQERLRADFWNEACKLASLHHPNVVAFYGVVLDGPGGSVATVTEYMANGSLRQALQRNDKVLDRQKRLLIAMDVAIGMEYLHEKNIVHFDLKSDNLLVDLRDPHRPICKVGDLGLSKVKCKTLISGGVRGTLPWMAPELLNGSSNLVSEKVDVFSFGIVMWELLTGNEPYTDLHYGAIIGGIVSNTLRPPVPESCDPEWRALMEWCWSSDPSERPTFTEVANRLRSMKTSLSKISSTEVI